MNDNLNTKCYYQSALDLHLPVRLHPEIDGFEIILGSKHYYFSSVLTPFNNSTSGAISQNKYYTNTLLAKYDIPVPKNRVIHLDDYKNGHLENIIASLNFPLVIKPLNGGLGKDVICDIKTFAKLDKLLECYLPVYNFLLIEEFHGNLNSYRVLIFNQRIIGVIQNFRAHVFGDGKHTVQELIDLTNSKRPPVNLFINFGHIKVDEECQIQLSNQGITLDSIPAENQKILLGYTRRGGSYKVLSTKISRKNKKLLLCVARITGLNLVGLDVECADINIPIQHSNGVIIETNHNPNITKHEMPEKGKASRVTEKMLRTLIYRHPLAWFSYLLKNKKISSVYRRASIAFGMVLLTIYLMLHLS